MQHSKLNLKKIAEELGVSVTTVSRVLNGQAARYRISKQTAEKVLTYARKYNFSPNEVARHLRLKKTHTLGLIVPDISNPFFASVARSIELEARQQGYFLVLCDSKDDTTVEAELLQLLKNRKVDGLIVAPVGLESSYFQELEDIKFPLVMIDRFLQGLEIPYVASDNLQGAYEAVNLFIQNGHIHIACLQGMPGTTTNENRVQGYRKALQEAGLLLQQAYIIGDNYGENNGYQSACHLLAAHPEITAFFCLSNLISLGALRAIAEAGKKVPEDVSIISFDEQPYSRFLATPMTTVAQQQAAMGKKAVELLFSQINTSYDSFIEQIIIPTQLIKRSSVKNLNT